MGIKESALSAITSIAQSDYIRAVTSAGASKRITLTNLAKAIIESYTGSSLAGSSQSVKAAIDSLNSNITAIIPGTTQSFASLDDIPINQFGYCTLTNSADYPAESVSTFCYFRYGPTTGRSALIAIRTASPAGVEMYVNAKHNDTWRGWKKVQLS